MILWVKAFHIIFVICWFAGIFYLPRLFVYHAMSDDHNTQSQLKIMERKLYRFVTPFAFLTVGLGLYLMFNNLSYYQSTSWFYAKSLCVLLLIGYHLTCGHFLRQFAIDDNRHSHKFYRIFNELPVLLLFTIVILVVVKPF